VKKYKPFLDEIGLTYTQYITMMALWEHGSLNVKSLGEHLYLDSGTLTPLLKKLEKYGLLSRSRSSGDERELVISLTGNGRELRGRRGTSNIGARDEGVTKGIIGRIHCESYC
jgi:DNA-binding MarR family transcriptional regulator